jgi:hypothetical protein
MEMTEIMEMTVLLHILILQRVTGLLEKLILIFMHNVLLVMMEQTVREEQTV